jgi:sulfate transport system substrate-binding protein
MFGLSPRGRNPLAVACAAALLLAGCGGASDVVDGERAERPSASRSPSPGPTGDAKLALVAFAVPKVAFDKLIPAFTATDEGRGVSFSQSYGASGDQSRKVEAGLETDVVLFSLEPDVTRLVKAGLVDANWKDGEDHGVPASSVVTMVVRKGDPKGIKDWSDLARDDVDVVSPNPFSSGSAKWNLLAPYLWKSQGGKDQAAGLDLVTDIVGNLKGQPKSGREATELFTAGTGDVLLSYENEAILLEKGGEDVEHVTPPTTLLIENPFAIIEKTRHRAAAEAFRDFVFSDEGQRLWGEAGFRPVDDTVAKDFAEEFPAPERLYKIDEVGGWDKVNELFAPETGAIAKIYDKATA